MAAWLVGCALIVAGLQSCGVDIPAQGYQVTAPPVTGSSVSSGTVVGSGSSTTCVCAPPSATTAVPSATTAAAVTKNDSLSAPPPRFSPAGGTLPIGASVRLLTDSLPAQAVVEYSADKGVGWVGASQFILKNGGTYQTRLRAGSRVTRAQSATFAVSYSRMLIIGNSIMVHAPKAEIGWPYNHGMAASAPANDFVHLLTGRLQQRYSAITTTLVGGVPFENAYWTFDLSQYDAQFAEKPDLIVVRIAENIRDDQATLRNLAFHYRRLLDYVASHAAPTHTIICTTSFWDQPQVDAVIRNAAAERGYPLACLCNLVNKPQYRASQFPDLGVAAHPNDAGMAEIARLIWEQAQ